MLCDQEGNEKEPKEGPKIFKKRFKKSRDSKGIARLFYEKEYR